MVGVPPFQETSILGGYWAAIFRPRQSLVHARLFGEMERFTVPEVHRAALEGSLLQVMALGIPIHRWGTRLGWMVDW